VLRTYQHPCIGIGVKLVDELVCVCVRACMHAHLNILYVMDVMYVMYVLCMYVCIIYVVTMLSICFPYL